MFLTEISESDILTIYDIVKFKCRTFIESVNLLFTMGSELEQEVDGIETSVGTSDDEASSSGSLWARVKYALANMVKTSDDQTIAGVKTFSSSPVIPTTPVGTTSAVNQAYVESTVDGVNNIVHKSGNEVIAGDKSFTGYFSTSHPVKSDVRQINTNVSGQTEWHKAYEGDITGLANYGDDAAVFLVSYLRRSAGVANSKDAIGILTVSYRSNSPVFNWLVAGNNIDVNNFKLTKKYDSSIDKTKIIIWVKVDETCNRYGIVKLMSTTLAGFVDHWYASTDDTAYSEPTTDDYDAVWTSTVMTIRS